MRCGNTVAPQAVLALLNGGRTTPKCCPVAAAAAAAALLAAPRGTAYIYMKPRLSSVDRSLGYLRCRGQTLAGGFSRRSSRSAMCVFVCVCVPLLGLFLFSFNLIEEETVWYGWRTISEFLSYSVATRFPLHVRSGQVSGSG